MEIDNNYTSSSLITRTIEYDLLSISSAEAVFFHRVCVWISLRIVRFNGLTRGGHSVHGLLTSAALLFHSNFLLSKSIISRLKDCSEFPTQVILLLNLSRVICLLHLHPTDSKSLEYNLKPRIGLVRGSCAVDHVCKYIQVEFSLTKPASMFRLIELHSQLSFSS